jgi:hypothetical protein
VRTPSPLSMVAGVGATNGDESSALPLWGSQQTEGAALSHQALKCVPVFVCVHVKCLCICVYVCVLCVVRCVYLSACVGMSL